MDHKNLMKDLVKKALLLIVLLTLLVFLGVKVYAADDAGGKDMQEKAETTLLKEIMIDKTAYFTNIRASIQGELKNYNAFKISDPFRIILDLWGVKNLIGKEQIAVNTPQVQGIKIAEQEDKVRLMIETAKDLPLPFLVTTENGDIVVSVGGGAEEKVTSLDRGVEPSPAVPEITGIDLEDFPEKSNVVISYSKKPVIEKKGSDGLAIVTVKKVKIAENLLRHLDATKFDIPVKMVDANRDGDDVSVKVAYERGHQYDVNEGDERLVLSFAKEKKVEKKGYRVAEYRAVKKSEMEARAAPSSPVVGEVAPFVTIDSMEQKVYRGQRISLDFKDADIHNVLRIIAEVSNLNIITSDEVKGKVTLRLVNIPWDQVLDIVLKTKGLGAKLEGNVLRIAPISKLREEEKEVLQSIKNKEELEELVIETIPVNFANVKELEDQIKEVMSARGKAKVDERTNTLVIKDIPKNIEKVRDLVKKLDTPTPQVLIEARIVEVSTQFTRELGVQWGAAYQSQPDGIFVSGIQDDTGTLFPDAQTPNPNFPTYAVNLPAAVGQGSGGGIAFGILRGDFRLDLSLSALETTGNGKIISSPKIVTTTNNEAIIQQGVKIPYSTVSASGTQTEFVDAALKLKVTPHITPDKTIVMELNAANDTPDFGNAVNGVPSISSREADTQVLIQDGETAVIGGILQIQRTESIDAVPWFHKIPLLGWFFKKETERNDNTELLIFITPKIIENSQEI
ncbi:MAG: type IV pilus secretin PilQ [Deltaproteobacteria bacterium]|nr:type IV pilus secretin PilQ [Deltaproteobacteria bacterium]NIS76629.1 type IV pilus secretin PilQ [Deltaproteobacteria bacterium]